MNRLCSRAPLLLAAVALTIAACDSDSTTADVSEAGLPDASAHDAHASDATAQDASSTDAAAHDASAADAMIPDAGAPDADGGTQTTTYKVGGTVSGLLGTGLVLQDNNGDDLAVAADGTFAFATKIAAGAAYAVTIKTQPTAPSQTCAVSGGTGTIAQGDVTTVAVTCASSTFAIGGTVSGLSGSGLVLEDNAGDDLAVNANGTFAFAKPIASGAAYAVTVKTQPASPTQTCVVSAGSGTVAAAAVGSVNVVCTTNTYAVGGSVSGLVGSGLKLKLNGGTSLAVSANGTFTFPASVASGATYAVTIDTQPTSPSQTCALGGATGTVVAAAVTSITVNCATNAYTIGGTASGIAGTGLVLQDNGGNDLSLTANGSFAFSTPVASGQPYAVTIKTQPTNPSQTCTLTNASGTVSANVTTVGLSCTTNAYAVGGSVSGLGGTGLILQDNGGDDLPVSSNGTFTFPTNVKSGQAYAVTVKSQPTGLSQTCSVTAGSGTVAAGAVSNVAVSCVTNKYTVSASVTGLAGTGLILENNGGDDLSVGTNGTVTFATSVVSGGAYAVTVKTPPNGPSQSCAVTAGSGTVTNGNVVSVNVNCATNSFAVGGSASGVAGTGLVLQDNTGDDLTVNQNGPFAFATSIASNGTYAITVKTQPTNPTQVCTVTNGSGTVGSSPITNVGVSCVTTQYTVGGTISGLAGSGLVLQNNATDDLTGAGNGTFTFATSIASNAAYAVTVKTQPTNQTCTVTNGSGTVTTNAITNVTVSCVATTYKIGGTLSGITSGTIVLQNNAGDNLSLTAAGAFSFATKLNNGAAYAVTVLTQPAGQYCAVTAGSGTVAAADVSSVSVACSSVMVPTFFWLDASDASTLTLGAVTGGITPVTQWRDKTGLGGRDANANPSAPEYTASATPNGKPAVFFNPTQERLVTGNVTTASEMTIFIVYKMVNPQSWACLFEQIHDTYFSIRKSQDTGGLNFHIQNDNAAPYIPLTLNTWKLVTAFRQGTTSSIGFKGSTPVTFTGDTLTGGQQAALYVGSSASNESSGSYIAEIQAFSSALTATQRSTIEGQLASKWAVP